MKLSVLTDEFTQDIDAAIAVASRYGLDAVELRTVENHGLYELPAADARRIAARIGDAGLAVSALSAPLFKCMLDDEAEIRRHRAGLEHCLALAEIFGTGLIRCFSFWRTEGPRPLQRVADELREAAGVAGEAGVKLALENDPATNACNAAEVAELLELVDSAHAGALWDPGNNLFAPAVESPFPDGYNRIRAHMLHVHLKDAVIGPDCRAEACLIAGGRAEIPALLQALMSEGYGGYATLETHYRRHAALSEAQLLLPGGAQFSEDGLGPTLECLDALNALFGRAPRA